MVVSSVAGFGVAADRNRESTLQPLLRRSILLLEGMWSIGNTRTAGWEYS
jgi:hypothetical protein